MKAKWNEDLKKMKKAINFERQEEIDRHETEIKKISGYEREKKGRALMDLRKRKIGQSLSGDYLYQFKKSKCHTLLEMNLEFKVGDEVLISQYKPLDKRNPKGTVYEINNNYITIACKEQLKMKSRIPIRIDLYLNDLAYKRMEKAVDNAINNRNSRGSKLVRGEIKNKTLADFRLKLESDLNDGQKSAVENALKSSDVALIQGPPGTGKTHTIIHLVKELQNRNQKILITAQSNGAVDNILRKLEEFKLPAMRIGNPIRVNKDLISSTLDSKIYEHENQKLIENQYETIQQLKKEQEKYTKPERRYTRGLSHIELLELASSNKGTRGIPVGMILSMKPWLEKQVEINDCFKKIDEIRKKIETELFEKHPIILTTNITAGSEILENKLFDVLIMDEAAQSTIPSSLIPIEKSKKYILVGDTKQLPATILSQKSKDLNLDLSLMESIDRKIPNISIILETQYRMNRAINDLTSEMFYNGKLKPSKLVENRYITELGKNIEWIDIDSEESFKGQSIVNIEEKDKVIALVGNLKSCNIESKNIGIIAPYKAQTNLIKQEIKDENIEIDTVDGFQGREKSIIILSMVRNNTNKNLGFLTDYRRLNVSISRAQSKLYIIGNKKHLSTDKTYKQLINLICK